MKFGCFSGCTKQPTINSKTVDELFLEKEMLANENKVLESQLAQYKDEAETVKKRFTAQTVNKDTQILRLIAQNKAREKEYTSFSNTLNDLKKTKEDEINDLKAQLSELNEKIALKDIEVYERIKCMSPLKRRIRKVDESDKQKEALVNELKHLLDTKTQLIEEKEKELQDVYSNVKYQELLKKVEVLKNKNKRLLETNESDIKALESEFMCKLAEQLEKLSCTHAESLGRLKEDLEKKKKEDIEKIRGVHAVEVERMKKEYQADLSKRNRFEVLLVAKQTELDKLESEYKMCNEKHFSESKKYFDELSDLKKQLAETEYTKSNAIEELKLKYDEAKRNMCVLEEKSKVKEEEYNEQVKKIMEDSENKINRIIEDAQEELKDINERNEDKVKVIVKEHEKVVSSIKLELENEKVKNVSIIEQKLKEKKELELIIRKKDMLLKEKEFEENREIQKELARVKKENEKGNREIQKELAKVKKDNEKLIQKMVEIKMKISVHHENASKCKKRVSKLNAKNLLLNENIKKRDKGIQMITSKFHNLKKEFIELEKKNIQLEKKYKKNQKDFDDYKIDMDSKVDNVKKLHITLMNDKNEGLEKEKKENLKDHISFKRLLVKYSKKCCDYFQRNQTKILDNLNQKIDNIEGLIEKYKNLKTEKKSKLLDQKEDALAITETPEEKLIRVKKSLSKKITIQQIHELNTYNIPPLLIHKVIYILLLLLEKEKPDKLLNWRICRNLLGFETLNELITFHPKLENLKPYYSVIVNEMKDIQLKSVKRVSSIAASLCEYVLVCVDILKKQKKEIIIESRVRRSSLIRNKNRGILKNISSNRLNTKYKRVRRRSKSIMKNRMSKKCSDVNKTADSIHLEPKSLNNLKDKSHRDKHFVKRRSKKYKVPPKLVRSRSFSKSVDWRFSSINL